MISISLSQRILLSIIFFGVGILRLIEKLGSWIRWTFVNSFRIALYSALLVVMLKGVYLESLPGPGLSNLPEVVTPNSQDVLGAVIKSSNSPELSSILPLPALTAKAVFAKDVNTGETLLDINSGEKLAPASTTKLMTALVAFDTYSLDDVVEIPELCTTIEGQKTGFLSQDKYVVRELMYSLMINSAADAACALSLGKVSYSDFVALMNSKAKAMGLENTEFTNPVGLDAVNGNHLSTAEDLYLLALEARKNPFIAESVQMKERTIKNLDNDETQVFNTNQLLWSVPGTVGIKTGKTEAAGEVLIYEYSMDKKDIIIVVMGSEDRFLDTQNILNWILASYSWEV